MKKFFLNNWQAKLFTLGIAVLIWWWVSDTIKRDNPTPNAPSENTIRKSVP